MEILNTEYYSEGYEIEPISNSSNETTTIKGIWIRNIITNI